MIRKLLSGVVTLLGFSSCGENIFNGGGMACEYGMPTVDYRVIGEVKDETGTPLQGIQVIVKDEVLLNKNGNSQSTYLHKGDTIYTDSKGTFESAKIYSISLKAQEVIFNDVDGEANGGEFESIKMSINDLDSKRIKKGDNWYAGEYELKAKVEMKKK
jgi:putative lipoprotein (rSAM/lipoprotein system)